MNTIPKVIYNTQKQDIEKVIINTFTGKMAEKNKKSNRL